MNTVDLGGVLHNKKMLMHNLKQNHHKLYISGKVMKFSFQQNLVFTQFNCKLTEAWQFEVDN